MESEVIEKENRINNALKMFSYFDTWNKETISDCCRLSKIKVFAPDEIIFGSDINELNGTHFIVDGTCKLIEHLQLVPKENPRRRLKPARDKLIDCSFYNCDEPKYSSLLFNIEKSISFLKTEKNEDVTDTDLNDQENNSESIPPSQFESNDCVGEGVNGKKSSKDNEKFSQFYRRFIPYISAKKKSVHLKFNDVDSHFLQIGLLYKGCCLGLGEQWQNRFLVSVTEVTCLIIPLQFLLQHNPNNIWNRIKQFLNNYLPNEDKILNEFFIHRKWNEDKRRLIALKNVKCTTEISDVPKSIRLNDFNTRLR